MRIAMVSEHANPLAVMGGVDAGGQNVHVAELAAALARRGHEVIVYTRRDAPGVAPEVRTANGYRVAHVPAGPASRVAKDELLPYMGEFARFLAEDWRVRRPDVAHSHFWMSGLVAARVGERLAVPVVHTYHALGAVKKRSQGKHDTSPPQRIALEREIGRSVTAVAATCSDEVFELIRMGIPRAQISVIPCGVNLQEFGTAGPRLDGLGSIEPRKRRHRVVSVGRLVPRKGFETGIRALARVAETELIIAGGPEAGSVADDGEARRLLSLADALGVRDRVLMPGRVPHSAMPALLRSADLVACTPWYEPFGIVPLEAMACGKPVVVTAVGGLTDTVVDGVTGIHVPPRDSDGLADALRGLLQDDVRRAAYGHAGYDRVRSRYSWDRIAADSERLYESCHRVAVRGLASIQGVAQ